MRKTSKEPIESGNELKEAIELLEKEKNISKDSLLEAIQNSLLSACKNHFGTSDNVEVIMDPDRYRVIQKKIVVEEVPEKVRAEEKAMYISLAEAKMIDPKYELEDIVPMEVKSREFGRIATGIAKNVILQKIREEERKVIYNDYFEKEHNLVTGVVQRLNVNGNGISISLGKCDTVLPESEQVKGEIFRPTDHIKLYVVEVKDAPKGPRISVSRTHPDLVRCLFEQEVSEVKDGTVEIKAIAREAGSRTKMAVYSNDENVDPVGACVGMNYARVSAVVDELHGEKIDIIKWDNDPALLIENALSPAKVILVLADEEDKEAIVIVPDYQLSLAIGKEGQNVRLAAKLTGYKIDIKSETQARDEGLFEEYGIDYQTGDVTGDEEGQTGEEA